MEYGLKEEYHCLECGQEIQYGRTNKKFCCEKCKNAYHYKEVRNARASHTRILSGINKNYEILTKIRRMGIRSIDLEELSSLGFNRYYTTGYKKRKKTTLYRCYEYEYRMTETKIFGISTVDLFDEQTGLRRQKKGAGQSI